MRYQVPQFIDIEDKIAFQLTAKQLGWFALGGFILFLLWTFFEFVVFVFFGLIVIGISAALAFVRINGASLIEITGQGFSFFFKPRTFIWRKTVSSAEGLYHKTEPPKNQKMKTKKKEIEDLDKIVNILDLQ